MKRRRIIVISAAVALVLLALLAIAFWPGEQEPEYQGKKLSEWVKSDWNEETIEGIRAIGTNGVPFLLKWLASEPPWWRVKLISSYAAHRNWIGRRFVMNKLSMRSSTYKPGQAVTGFLALGERANRAVPQLTAIAREKRPRAAESAKTAILCLSFLGQDALPSLLAISGDQARGSETRAAGISALSNMELLGTNALPAIPVLTAALGETNLLIRNTASNVLQTFCYPAVFGWVGTENGWMVPDYAHPALRLATIRALADMATNDLAFGLAVQGTNDADPRVQIAAWRAMEIWMADERGAKRQ
jgi:hypothetical protein